MRLNVDTLLAMMSEYNSSDANQIITRPLIACGLAFRIYYGRIYRRILQSEMISHPTPKTHCRMNEISRKFPEFAIVQRKVWEERVQVTVVQV